jgi:hypothetical protein
VKSYSNVYSYCDVNKETLKKVFCQPKGGDDKSGKKEKENSKEESSKKEDKEESNEEEGQEEEDKEESDKEEGQEEEDKEESNKEKNQEEKSNKEENQKEKEKITRQFSQKPAFSHTSRRAAGENRLVDKRKILSLRQNLSFFLHAP